MVKRTRRNLSDPRIKRIIQQQLHSTYQPHRSVLTGKNYGHIIGRILLGFTALLIFTGFILFLRSVKLPEVKLPWQASPTTLQESKTPPQPLATKEVAQGVSNASQTDRGPGENSQPEKPIPEPAPRKIQVEVLNGCGVDGLALQLTRYLRRKNIDVVAKGNYSNYGVQKTVLLDRIGDVKKSQKLAEILGLSRDQIKIEKDVSLQLDATIIIGADYQQLKPFSR